MKDLLDILQLLAARKADVKDPLDLYLDMAERVVKFTASQFNVKNDEVAILVLSCDSRHLKFVAPRQFAPLGSIPVTKRDSIAVGVLKKRVGEATNNVPMVRHVAFFESVKIRDRAAPIQKMITVPIVADGDVLGVAQVSRKGENPNAAGPDFTRADLQKAMDLFSAVGPHLSHARPDQF